MIIGFMGKGGSGKTTMSTLFVQYLLTQGQTVLAIDADHNMDFVYNLAGEQAEFPYLGENRAAIRSAAGLVDGEKYAERLLRGDWPAFTLGSPDAFTKAHTRPIAPNLLLMAAGPHTEEIRQGAACSHVLSSALKLYVPCLSLNEHEACVIDSTAGMDMVGTGIATAMDQVFICTEPTVHATKTAKQIAAGLDWYGVPHAFVLTKTQNEAQRAQAEAWLGASVRFVVPFGAGLEADERVTTTLEGMRAFVREEMAGRPPSVRRDRAVESAKKGIEYQEKRSH